MWLTNPGANYSTPDMADLGGGDTEQHDNERIEEEEELAELREEWKQIFDEWKTDLAAWKAQFTAYKEGARRNCTN